MLNKHNCGCKTLCALLSTCGLVYSSRAVGSAVIFVLDFKRWGKAEDNNDLTVSFMMFMLWIGAHCLSDHLLLCH